MSNALPPPAFSNRVLLQSTDTDIIISFFFCEKEKVADGDLVSSSFCVARVVMNKKIAHEVKELLADVLRKYGELPD